jgi:hypothetical protein
VKAATDVRPAAHAAPGQPVAAVRADIVKGPHHAFIASDDDQRGVEEGQVADEIAARPRQIVLVANRQPGTPENLFPLLVEFLGMIISGIGTRNSR